MYDKGIEERSEDRPGTKWRYEVELKGNKAKQAAYQLQAYSAREATITHPIAVTVYDWFNRREVPPLFKRTDAESLDLSLRTKTNTDDARLIWLRKQVAPTVREFLMSERREVLDALGVTDFFRVKRIH